MNTPYLLQVLIHKYHIVLCGFGHLPLWRLLMHDWTKFLPVEFVVYRQKFTGKLYKEETWQKAKAHHYSHNPHHYQYWIRDGKTVPMPETYITEMVIDWMAAGASYTGSKDIQPWLNENHKYIQLHEDTKEKLKQVLISFGFTWPE